MMPSSDLQIHSTIPPQRVDRNGLSIREDVLYTDAKGREKSKLRKRANEAFDDLSDVLRRVLEPNETIFYIAPAQVMPGAVAQFFGGGWHAYSLPRTLFFFSDRRIIAFRLRKRMRGWIWNRGIRTVRWGDVAQATPGGFISRHLVLKFRNGEQQRYWRFAWGDLKKVRQLIELLRAHGAGESTAAGGRVSLCPGCLAVLAPRNYRCQGCGVQFKDEKTLLWRAIVIPGGASLYVGASGLGVLRAVFEAIILAGILISLFNAVREPRNSTAVAALMTSVAAECIILFLDKAMAYSLSLPQIRAFIPVE
jgi:hypothetical protein